ncbi:hypothetical protein [Jeotgalibacillus sp. R-1-5s-1]|uniref:hypothetical protein n=1 Tax=Jeotgalibacillus sp. R-1-5s-1 TaxID=2555897 RepID=UPI00106B60B2|nr:hypothetical protein [Jeotgalibacillus sp. R-1-5s-1]TFD99917.1 hypothetical protein E2491_05580 [Jeotgalibacillus sp. R-1-5s-1]
MKESEREMFQQKKKSLRIVVFLLLINMSMFAIYPVPISDWLYLFTTILVLSIVIWLLSMIYTEKEGGMVFILSLSGTLTGFVGRLLLEWGEVSVTHHMNIWNVGLYVIGIPIMILVLQQVINRVLIRKEIV